MNFKLGDRVKITEMYSRNKGQIGSISFISSTPNTYEVALDSGEKFLYGSDQFVLVSSITPGIDPNDVQIELVELDNWEGAPHKCHCDMATIWREGCRCKGV